MIKQIYMLTLICICSFLNFVYSQYSLLLDPSQAFFQIKVPPNFYDADSPVRVSINSAEEWSISCIVEILLFENNIISHDRILMKKEGEENFQPMTTAIHIGSGGPTPLEEYQEITTLYLRVQVLETDAVGTYEGSIKLFNTDDEDQTTLAVLPMTFINEPHINFDVVDPQLVNVFVTGAPDVYDGDNQVTLSVNGNTTDWTIMASFEGSEYFKGENFYIKSSGLNYWNDEGVGNGFLQLKNSRRILDGSTVGTSGTTDLKLKIQTSWDIPPDIYNTRIKIDAQKNEYKNPQYIDLNIEVPEYLSIELSESEVRIKSDGPPGEYSGDRNILLKIASNTQNWQARALGENLKSSDDEILAERVLLFSSNQSQKGYMPLNEEQIIASGISTQLEEVSSLSFKVKTTWEDKAGVYNGKVYFTVFAMP